MSPSASREMLVVWFHLLGKTPNTLVVVSLLLVACWHSGVSSVVEAIELVCETASPLPVGEYTAVSNDPKLFSFTCSDACN